MALPTTIIFFTRSEWFYTCFQNPPSKNKYLSPLRKIKIMQHQPWAVWLHSRWGWMARMKHWSPEEPTPTKTTWAVYVRAVTLPHFDSVASVCYVVQHLNSTPPSCGFSGIWSSEGLKAFESEQDALCLASPKPYLATVQRSSRATAPGSYEVT